MTSSNLDLICRIGRLLGTTRSVYLQARQLLQILAEIAMDSDALDDGQEI